MKKTNLYTCLCIALLSTAMLSCSTNAQDVGASIDHAASATGRAIDDSAITTDIKAKYLANTDLKSLRISVTTVKGIVTLQGSVDQVSQYQLAVQIAKKSDGVISVNANQLVVT
ncbi:MAG: BON domain-containing protein [Pseudomonadota bacterium]